MDPIIKQEFELDFLAYQQHYCQPFAEPRKPRGQATKPGKIDHNGPPIDFSFLNLQDVQSLRKEKERPNMGKRKPIEKDDEEEDTKKNELNGLPGDDKANAVDTKDKKENLVIKNTSIPQVTTILANYSVSLNSNKIGGIGGRKQEDGGEEASRKKEVTVHVNGVLLNNNCLRDIIGLHDVLSNYVLYEPDRLQWLNLSYNYLVTIDDEITKFDQLKTLQLHGNCIKDLEEVRKLNQLPMLQNLTLNGNPIEEIKGYRLYVLGMMYQYDEMLRRFDSVIVTQNEFDAVLVWNKKLLLQYDVLQDPKKDEDVREKDREAFMKAMKRLKPQQPIKKPPEREDEENGAAAK